MACYIPLVRYLPTFCEPCGRASLVPQTGIELVCPACGEPSRVIPGAFYTMSDLLLFAQVEAVVYDAWLSRFEACRIADELESYALGSKDPQAAFARVDESLPGVRLICDSVKNDATRLLRALGMLLTVVRARCHAPPRVGKSGTYPAFLEDLFVKVPAKGSRR